MNITQSRIKKSHSLISEFIEKNENNSDLNLLIPVKEFLLLLSVYSDLSKDENNMYIIDAEQPLKLVIK